MNAKNSTLLFQNLVAFAWSDGLDASEKDFLLDFANRNKINKKEALSIIENKGEIIIPNDDKLKRILLNHTIDLAMVDGVFSNEELRLCNQFVWELGLDESMLILTKKLLAALNESDKQKEIIRKQKNEIEVKNTDIQASLRAAKKIQRAIMTPDILFKRYLPDSFVLYQPKDIVSGDFYWVEPCTTHKCKSTDSIFVAAVDCTGHGVPGAFMSIVGCNGLKRIVREYKLVHPGEILKELNTIVGENLHQDENKEIRNGMDIALCTLHKQTRKLEYAGAINSLYIIKKKKKTLLSNHSIEEKYILEKKIHTLYEIKGDKIYIGANEEEQNFKNHTLQLEKGDTFYICSDGYVDQNGGPKDKKFSSHAFKELLLNIQKQSMEEQKETIHKAFEEWKGNREQRDDIVVIGIKIE